MLLSISDILLLKILCWCKHIPNNVGSIFAKQYSQEEISGLCHYDLISVSRDKSTLRPRSIAYSILSDAGFYVKPQVSFRTDRKLVARRNIASEILFTMHMAGVSVFNTEIPREITEPVYIASFAARASGEGNPFGSTRFHGILCAPQEAFLVFYVDNLGMFFRNELGLFHNFIQAAGIEKRAVLLVGRSSEEIAAGVFRDINTKPTVRGSFKTDTFADIHESCPLPVHFVPLGAEGAQMLRFMLQPGYREKTAKAVFGSMYSPPYAEMLDTDTIHPRAPNYPGIVAVEMDTRRIDRAFKTARVSGHEKIAIYALTEQISFLKKHYAGRADVYGINTAHVKAVIGFDIMPTLPPKAAYVLNDGRCFSVTDFAKRAKKPEKTARPGSNAVETTIWHN